MLQSAFLQKTRTSDHMKAILASPIFLLTEKADLIETTAQSFAWNMTTVISQNTELLLVPRVKKKKTAGWLSGYRAFSSGITSLLTSASLTQLGPNFYILTFSKLLGHYHLLMHPPEDSASSLSLSVCFLSPMHESACTYLAVSLCSLSLSLTERSFPRSPPRYSNNFVILIVHAVILCKSVHLNMVFTV